MDELAPTGSHRDSSELGGRSGNARAVGALDWMPGLRSGSSWRVVTNHTSSGKAKGTAGRLGISACKLCVVKDLNPDKRYSAIALGIAACQGRKP